MCCQVLLICEYVVADARLLHYVVLHRTTLVGLYVILIRSTHTHM